MEGGHLCGGILTTGSWGSRNNVLQVWEFTTNRFFPCASRAVGVSIGRLCLGKFLHFAPLKTEKQKECRPVLTFCRNAPSQPGPQTHVKVQSHKCISSRLLKQSRQRWHMPAHRMEHFAQRSPVQSGRQISS